MENVKRIYPGAKNGLINFIEENFHDIDSYVATFTFKDGSTTTAYECSSMLEAFGIIGMAQSTMHKVAYDDEFTPKKDSEHND